MSESQRTTDPSELSRRLAGNGHIRGEQHAASKARPIVRCMSDVEPRHVDFLWPGYIVRHKFNLIAGYGRVGKGQVMANIIARLSRGDPMPEEATGSAVRALILAAEDDAHEDIRPRLDANRANLDNILIMDGVDLGDGDARWVDIQQHISLLKAAVVENSIDLVYLDPLASYMPGVKRQDGGQVRDALNHIQRLINETSVTVIGALHLGKEALNRRGAMKVLDSVEYVNHARNVIGVNELPEEYQPEEIRSKATLGRRKLLAVLKSNSMIPGPPLLWSRPQDAEVQWHGVSPVSFDESFTTAPPETARGGAKEWLFEYLKGGMQLAAAVMAEGKAVGFSERTLKRAKGDLNIESIKDSSGPWYWKLPDDVPRSGNNPEPKGANQDGQPPTHGTVAPLASIDRVDAPKSSQ